MAAEALLASSGDLIANPVKTYNSAASKLNKIFQVLERMFKSIYDVLYCMLFQAMHPFVSSLGHITHIRQAICNKLSSSISFESKLLHSSLKGLQEALLNDAMDTSILFPPKQESELLSELVSYLQWVGLEDPKKA